ncbi:hypothetical protein LTR66_012979 [Elasticomyces elasticus]|nr:hypothetical protein LTR66_012979 [Elasticomyces elasticus]
MLEDIYGDTPPTSISSFYSDIMKISRAALYVVATTLGAAALSDKGQQYLDHAINATGTLNNVWYNEDSGVWQDLWWQSGNILETISDLCFLSESTCGQVEDMLVNTYTAAQGIYPGFVNDFYDDESWWALGWIRAYDVAQNETYLKQAQSIFDDMVGGYNATCGGHWWNKAKTANTAIGNGLFLSVAAQLANRRSKDPAYYLNWALAEWEWFNQSGLINDRHLINDGLDLTTCKNNKAATFTYNQGVVIGALVALNEAQDGGPDSDYLRTAGLIADATITDLTDANGILTEPGSADPDVTGAQFKGVFLRNLQKLQQTRPQQNFVDFIQANADSLWERARDAPSGFVGPAWAGPFYTATAASQCSAIDCLVAAAAVS